MRQNCNRKYLLKEWFGKGDNHFESKVGMYNKHLSHSLLQSRNKKKKIHIIIPFGLVFTKYLSILRNVDETVDH